MTDDLVGAYAFVAIVSGAWTYLFDGFDPDESLAVAVLWPVFLVRNVWRGARKRWRT